MASTVIACVSCGWLSLRHMTECWPGSSASAADLLAAVDEELDDLDRRRLGGQGEDEVVAEVAGVLDEPDDGAGGTVERGLVAERGPEEVGGLVGEGRLVGSRWGSARPSTASIGAVGRHPGAGPVPRRLGSTRDRDRWAIQRPRPPRSARRRR